MKNLNLILTAFVIALLIPSGTILADNTKTITVACTIPLIPGVNAPLIKEEPANIVSDETSETATEEVIVEERIEESEIVQQEEATIDNITRWTFVVK